ncbi:hypothetical protein RhiirA5_354711 [Rhizophagus irregularis]|uniref:Uncharacterized protein n=4 Tax=Rhizophagus irregularis TaxID=588596 RepID=A0A2I1E5E7_9GLOM|nr:hypothetical protein GLOIN_2v1502700 [Rhizophagus irregularis DAOM 181602=DAOM 197198]EXX51694.1 hypothetical protein RirG_259440 [Rhizophagus irregularis DAOM 197198w]PKC11072.1 hypothetical protein RhiirA5_354711 [Rhizophagus irregularis]PKC69823.1 hypothetical protein RhiirA1_533169 [Rhizophagus irregularis]PKY17353.1 hypothetical protein RhiirB3_521930 [Rhizophagus irregularis]POG82077.1 hypothetical protein GLOIN_2v1502700 [Rhizophagus irregularis DAOM 181602=DAOM 197198]|eukprot:XP_025188943.1 hypothetical protein GLOIN_2v1502700 [Rhizophagus irregularis DAOM 181602=DAOM 197198]
MMNSRFIVFSAFLLVLISMILSVSAAPVPRSDLIARAKEADINDQDVLLTDAIPVTSNGGDLKPYNKDDEVDQKVVDDGNESQGDGKGLKI